MTFHIPLWVFYALGVAVWAFAAFAVLFGRTLDGSDQRERLIVSLAIAAVWPFTLAWNVLSALWRKP